VLARPRRSGGQQQYTVRSVLGRFLEHSRVFLFEAGDTTSLFIGSADLMPRNLDQRIELVVPVEDATVGREVRSVLDIMLTDTKLAWELNRTGSRERVKPEKDQPGRSSQGVLMERWRSGRALAPRKPRRKRKDQRESGWR
jgi:polyphosphate kinase